jgi:ABC-type antimicrobial peptide transport system permease subunit
MLKLAIRQIQLDPVRTLLTAIAIGSVIAVVLVLKGFEQGQYFQLEQMVLKRSSDLVVAQSGVRNFIAVRSSIPQTVRTEIEEIDGVESSYPLTAIPLIHNVANLLTPVYVLVIDTGGGPSSIVEGNGIKNSRDIVIDSALAKKYGIRPGDDFIISDFKFKVAGITREAAFMMPFAFISYDGMIDLYLESEIAPDLSTFPMLSYLMLKLDEGADPDKVASSIEKLLPSVDVYTPEQVAARDVNMGRTFFAPIMGLLVVVTYIIGLLVVALIIYADVRGRLRDFAVLKAIGFPFRSLVAAVIIQAVLLLIIALPVAVVVSYGLSIVIHYNAPVYMIYVFEPILLTRTFVAAIVLSVIGALIPLELIRRSDPAIVFEGG